MMLPRKKSTTAQLPLELEAGLLDPAQVPLDPIGNHPDFLAARKVLDALEQRLARSNDRMRLAKRRKRKHVEGALDRDSHMARALELVQGGEIEASDPDAVMAACEVEQESLVVAIRAAHEALEEVRGRISVEVMARFAPINRAAVLATYHAMVEVWAGMEVQLAIIARLKTLGYAHGDGPLPTFAPGFVWLMGSVNNQHSQARAFRNWLVSQGWLQEGSE